MITKRNSRTEVRPFALILLLALSIVMLPAQATMETIAYVGRESATIYPTAHISEQIIGTLLPGTMVKVISYDANWAQIRLDDGSGYVVTGLINFNLPQPITPTVEPIQPAIPPVIATVTVADGPLQVHSAPTLRAPVIAKLATGARVNLSSYDSNWAEVVLSETQLGYVVTSYLNFGAPSPVQTPRQTPRPTASPDTIQTQDANATITAQHGGPVHLRSEARDDADFIGSYANGSRIRVLSTDSRWYYVQANALYGYMDGQYITLDEEMPMDMSSLYIGVVKTPNADQALVLRKRPGTDSVSLMSCHSGTIIEVLVMGTEWNHVRVDGVEGYMMAEYVEVVTPGASPMMILQAAEGNEVSVMRTPSDTGDMLVKASSGTQVTVRRPDDMWTEITIETGGEEAIGYVRNDCLSPISLPDRVYQEVG